MNKLLLSNIVFSETAFWTIVVGVILAVALLLSLIYILNLRKRLKNHESVARRNATYFSTAIDRVPFNDNDNLVKEAFLLEANMSLLGDNRGHSIENDSRTREIEPHPSLAIPEGGRQEDDTSPSA